VSYLGIGTGLAVTLLLAMGAGYWIDKRFGTAPVFVLVGAAIGMFAVFYHLYKAYKAMTRRP
jgi:F0F1-type ATP synthase assembly protein I